MRDSQEEASPKLATIYTSTLELYQSRFTNREIALSSEFTISSIDIIHQRG
jgi:hypothetical protein